jgi:catechol 2,3-dioxygenase-like lactoylglutathione lyase family enzyme
MGTRPPRRLDHLVLAVRDLEAAAGFYARLGFLVGARNQHPWGTANHVVQLRTSYLELITVVDAERIPPHSARSFSFGRFVRDHLAEREGLAMLALSSGDARADAEEYARRGIGDFEPFSFERSGRAADGSETHLAFSLAFASDDRLPWAGFFVCQQHHPEAFWSAPLQRHDNGATDVSAARLGLERPGDHTGFLRAFTGVEPTDDGLRYGLAHGGHLDLEASPVGDRFSGFSVVVPDLDVVARRLVAEDIAFDRFRDHIEVAADRCFGARITFEPRPDGGPSA